MLNNFAMLMTFLGGGVQPNEGMLAFCKVRQRLWGKRRKLHSP